MEKKETKKTEEKITKRQFIELRSFLKNFASTANNIVMLGQYSGDAVHAASKFMNQCHQIVETIEKDA